MADTESKPEPYWVEQNSKDGKKYQASYQNAEEAAEAAKIAEEDDGAGLIGGNYATVPVDWPVGSSGSLSGSPVGELGITKYTVKNNSWSIYDYKCEFGFRGPACKLWFKDEEGDEYYKLVIDDGDFSFAYNSKKPKIVSIKFVRLVGK